MKLRYDLKVGDTILIVAGEGEDKYREDLYITEEEIEEIGEDYFKVLGSDTKYTDVGLNILWGYDEDEIKENYEMKIEREYDGEDAKYEEYLNQNGWYSGR